MSRNNKIQQFGGQSEIIDFDFNTQKDVLMTITRDYTNLFRIKNNDHQNMINSLKLIKSSTHQRQFKRLLQNSSLCTTQLCHFLHHSIYKTQHFLHVDDIYSQYKSQINNLKVDSYGLMSFSTDNVIYLAKSINTYDKEFNVNFKNHSKSNNNNKIYNKNIVNLAQLSNHMTNHVQTYYIKNSLIISGAKSGLICLWDINKSKTIFSTEYLKYPISHIGSYLNFQDTNLYWANYKDSKNVIFCDIRTNKPIKIVNQFMGQINCQVSKKGLLIGTNSSSIDFIDIQSYFKSYRLSNQTQTKTENNHHQNVQTINSKKFIKNKRTQSQKQNISYNLQSKINKKDLRKTEIQNQSINEGYLQIYKRSHGINKDFSQQKQRKMMGIMNSSNLMQRRTISANKSTINSNKNTHRSNLPKVHQNIIQQPQPINHNFCSILSESELYIGKKGSLQLLKYNQVNLESKNKNKHFKSYQIGDHSPIVKIVENYTGAFVLNKNGSLYHVSSF